MNSPDGVQDIPDAVEVLIVGSGMAGLTSARELTRAGRQVLVIDKGRGPGGRLATRWIGDAVLDHGAPFFAATDAKFSAEVARWRREGAVRSWGGREGESTESARRWCGAPAMATFGRYLARGLALATSTKLDALRREGDRWCATLADGREIQAEAALLTPPVPQTLALMDAGGVGLAPATRAVLEAIRYERCLAVLAVLDGPVDLAGAGLVEFATGPLAKIIDNQVKGVSAVPAVTLLADAAFSLARWDDDRTVVAAELIAAAAPWLGVGVIAQQVHGWRYCRPTTTSDSPCLEVCETPPLILAGDAFGGPDVAGAFRSGQAAAHALLVSF